MTISKGNEGKNRWQCGPGKNGSGGNSLYSSRNGQYRCQQQKGFNSKGGQKGKSYGRGNNKGKSFSKGSKKARTLVAVVVLQGILLETVNSDLLMANPTTATQTPSSNIVKLIPC